ncbi:MAG: phenylacetate--CoA ligase family protein [Methylococcaceae bacterium]|nr:phenylacetate--CoA ligase family protein [Methylococcaceae bacterium]
MHPFISREIVYRLQESLMRRPTFAYAAELERSQWLSRPELEQLQTVKLKTLLKIALEHSPWHAQRIRAAGLELGENAPFGLEDLRRLPTMNKQDAANNRESLVWRGIPGGVFRYNTGGSSGQPLIFYFGRQRQAADAAARIRARRWWGVEFGEPEVFLWGSPVELNRTDKIKNFRDRLLNQLVLNAFEMSVANMDDYIEQIQSFDPVCMYGYASSLALLAARVRDRGIKLRLPRLKLVCTTGEPLFPHQREIIAEHFGVPVANEFGSRDVGLNAHESPAGQMLLTSESVVMEALDSEGKPVAPGEIGEAVMTGLCSQAQPFIRYRTGDMVRYAEEFCRQGRGLHVVGEVIGRSTDFIVRADGTVMHALAIIYVLRAVPGVAEFKCLQHDVGNMEIWVVQGPAWEEGMREQIVQGIKARLGDTVRVEVKSVEHIPAEASGKHRYVVSHVPLPAGLSVAS